MGKASLTPCYNWHEQFLIIASGILRCLMVLRHRLYAEGSGQTLRKWRCYGQAPVGHPS